MHAVSGEDHSLPVFYEVMGTDSGSSENGIPSWVIGLVALVALAWVGSLALIRYRSDEQIEGMIPSFMNRKKQAIDAEILE